MQELQFDTEYSPAQFEAIDARAVQIRNLMERASAEDIASLWYQLDVSAIYHDCALEGQVLSPEELDAAFNVRVISDASRTPLYNALRNHRAGFDLMRAVAAMPWHELTIELFKQFHQAFAADPEDGRAGRFRTETPLHRSYFHEICEPDKIAPSLRKLIAWMNDPAEAGQIHAVERAARFHRAFMHIFPYTETSGKIGRAVMNALLVHSGYLPAIVHATERQRYYEALRGKQQPLTTLVVESAAASLEAASRYLKRTV
jgi:Fic family protein